MSLKDEIDKLIDLQRQQIRLEEGLEEEWQAQQTHRFHPVRGLIGEIVSAVDTRYLEASLLDDQATIRLGRRDPHFIADIVWEIQLDNSIDYDSPDHSFKQTGFIVNETTHLHMERRTLEHTYSLETERDVVQHLIHKIAEGIAWYKHLDDVRAGLSGQGNRLPEE